MRQKFNLLLIFLLGTVHLFGQNLTTSRQSSYYTYIYSLTDEEMSVANGKKRLTRVDQQWFHTLVDSFPTDSGFTGTLKPGNYLKVYAEQQRLIMEVTRVFPVYPLLIDNQKDLIIRMVDSAGTPVGDACLWVRKKRIPYDPGIGAYCLRNSGQEGIVRVEYQGYTTWYSVNALHRTPNFRNGMRQMTRSRVVQYIWKPVRTILKTPVDLISSIIWWYPSGIMQAPIHKLRCMINKENCWEYERRFMRKHTGFLVFNQPIYRPGDTVYYKAYVIKQRTGRGVGKQVEAEVYAFDESHVVQTLSPYRKGAYHGMFVLSDSLSLRLDRDYRLKIKEKNGSGVYINSSFRYEDYVLSGLNLTLSANRDQLYRGNELFLEASGKDENGFWIKDGRYEVLILSGQVDRFFEYQSFIPDTLGLFYQEALPDRPSRIAIADSIFPRLNMQFTVAVALSTSDNRRVSERQRLHYIYHEEKADIVMMDDSIRFAWIENDLRVSAAGAIYHVVNEKDKKLIWEGELPVTLGIDHSIRRYRLETKGMIKELWPGGESYVFNCKFQPDRDSLIVSIVNPRRFPLTWFVYRKGVLIDQGFGNRAEYGLKYKGHNDFLVRVHYLCAGIDKYQVYRYHEDKNNLVVHTSFPSDIYPGQEITVDVEVKDIHGNPVANADLTAFAYSGKFDLEPMLPPSFRQRRSSYRSTNSFDLIESIKRSRTIRSSEDEAYRQMHLDSITWYRFMYPGSGIYHHSEPSLDGRTTLAPFLNQRGRMVPVNAVFLNDVPVWFSWVTTMNPYSIVAEPGPNRIEILTDYWKITIDSVVPEPGMKNFLSIDIHCNDPKVKVRQLSHKEYLREIAPLKQFTMQFQVKRSDKSSDLQSNRVPFLKQEGVVYPLNQGNYNNSQVVGPVFRRPTMVVMPDYYTIDFRYEPGYTYHFSPGLLKMICNGYAHRINQSRSNYGFKTAVLLDEPHDEARLVAEDLLRRNRHLAGYPEVKLAKSGKEDSSNLIAKQQAETGDKPPVFSMLYHQGQQRWERFCGSGSAIFTGLSQGSYLLFHVWDDGSYKVFDSIIIKKNMTSYYPLWQQAKKGNDSLSAVFKQLYLTCVNTGNVSPELILRQLCNAPASLRMSKDQHIQDIGSIQADEHAIQYIDEWVEPPMLLYSASSYSPAAIGGTFRQSCPAYNSEIYEFATVSNVQLVGNTRDYKYRAVESRSGTLDFFDTEHFSRSVEDSVLFVPGWNSTASLRNNFSDCAFWQPALRTDHKGKASFTLTFPDDVTAWDAHFMVMGNKKQTGYTRKVIKSYKPMLAQLNLPGFLVEGDSVQVIATVFNYTNDTLEVSRSIEVNSNSENLGKALLIHAIVDSIGVVANTSDSLWLKYLATRDNGWFDGERRSIPVRPRGMEEITASFHLLHRDSTLTLSFDTLKGEVRLQLLSDMPSILKEAIDQLIDYKYDCNEQLASRLLALLKRREMESGSLSRYVTEKKIQRICQQLLDGRNREMLWGWWKGSATTWWVTEHVVYALSLAKDAGFADIFDPRLSHAVLAIKLKETASAEQKISIFRCLKLLNPGPGNLPESLGLLARSPNLSTLQKFRLYEVQLQSGSVIHIDSIMQYRHQTFTGTSWFGLESAGSGLIGSDFHTTLIAYRILREMPGVDPEVLRSVRGWLMHYRSVNQLNTYTLALWMDAIFSPETIMEIQTAKPAGAMVEVNGSITESVTTSPWIRTIPSGDTIQFRLLNSQHVYISADQRNWVDDPQPVNNGFMVSSQFENGQQVLRSGKAVNLNVQLEVAKDAEFVLIEVPIPAGCFYSSQTRSHPVETYREQYKTHTAIFCQELKKGTYHFTITLMPRFSGSYTMNPARAEMMYIPAVNGNGVMKRVVVQE